MGTLFPIYGKEGASASNRKIGGIIKIKFFQHEISRVYKCQDN